MHVYICIYICMYICLHMFVYMYVYMRYNLQSLQNKLALCVLWNSIFFKQPVQGFLVVPVTESFIEKIYFCDQIGLAEK